MRSRNQIEAGSPCEGTFTPAKGLTTPPYAKRRKSAGSAEKSNNKVSRPVDSHANEDMSGISTPRKVNRAASTERVPPAAPRKVRRPTSSSDGPTFEGVEVRRLDFGLDDKRTGPMVVTSPDVDWDDFLIRSNGTSNHTRRKEIIKAMRLLGGRLETIPGNTIPMAEFRNLLNSAFPDLDAVIKELEEEAVIFVDRASGTVSMLKTPPVVLDSITTSLN